MFCLNPKLSIEMAATGTEVERAILTIVNCFFTHSKAEGKQDTLSFTEFTNLATKELPHMMKDISLEEKMKELDINQDDQLKFNEFWRLVGEMAKNAKRDLKGKKK
ncbi:protein S100-A13 isoform X1 [Pelobates fuscus]|uniref:protein S100-A13 isoform X1 n=2 Tax=Pelobates fuscus TaxID=191477 RepID=UPI002FE4A040